MKFEVPSSKILPLLQIVSRIVSPKSNLPILEHMLFSLKGNELTISGSDMGNRLDARIEVENTGGENGRFCASARAILDPIKEMADQPLTLEVDLASLDASITYANGHYSFKVVDADPYPEEPATFGEMREFELPTKTLTAGINATIFASSNEERRPIMTGVFFDASEDMLVFVGSDGRILARYQDHNVKLGGKFSFCLPKRAASLLLTRLLTYDGEKDAENIKMSVDDRHIVFHLKHFTLWTRMLEGRYPNYNSVIPTENPYNITFDRLALLSAAKRISVFASEGTQMIRFEFSNGGVRLMANDHDYSMSGEEFVKADESPEDINLRLGFDASVFMAILSSLSTEDVKIALIDQTRAALILPGSEEEGTDLCILLLPMRLIEQ